MRTRSPDGAINEGSTNGEAGLCRADKFGEPEMNNDDINPIKLRRAPNGRLYAVCHAQPVCRSDGNLRYFQTEHEAWTFLAEGRVEDSLEVLSA